MTFFSRDPNFEPPILVGYWYDSSMPLKEVAKLPYSIVNLAFIYPYLDSANWVQLRLTENLGRGLKFHRSVLGGIRALQDSGKIVSLSFGGAGVDRNVWHSINNNPGYFAEEIAGLCNKYDLRVDIDFEDTRSFVKNGASYDGSKFLINMTKALYNSMTYTMSHAPQAPYLCDPSSSNNINYCTCPGYNDVMSDPVAGPLITYLYVQLYNNAPYDSAAAAVDYYGSLVEGWAEGPVLHTENILIGKPVSANDASSGYIPSKELIGNIIEPLMKSYPDSFGGIMGWQISSDSSGKWARDVGSALGTS